MSNTNPQIPPLYTSTGSPNGTIRAERIVAVQPRSSVQLQVASTQPASTTPTVTKTVTITSTPTPAPSIAECTLPVRSTHRTRSPVSVRSTVSDAPRSPGRPTSRTRTRRVPVVQEVAESTTEEYVEPTDVDIEEFEQGEINTEQAEITYLDEEVKQLRDDLDAFKQSDKFNNISNIAVTDEKLLYPSENTVVVRNVTKDVRQSGFVNVLNSIIVQGGYGLRVFSTETPMGAEQDRRYELDVRSQYEYRGNTQPEGVYSPLTNFVYPKDIWDPTLPLDSPTAEGGWIDRNSVIAQLGVYSPKLNFMYNLIMQRRTLRHVIYSKYLTRYGVDLIVAILRVSGLNPLVLTYDFRDPAGRSRGTHTRQPLVAIQKFNTDPRFNIIVTNLNSLDAALIDVDYWHMLDMPTPGTFTSYINKMYHMQYYRLRKVFTIVFHLSERKNNTKSLDHYQFERIYLDCVDKLNNGVKLL